MLQTLNPSGDRSKNKKKQKDNLIKECQKHYRLCTNCLHNGHLTVISSGFNCYDCIEDMRDPPW